MDRRMGLPPRLPHRSRPQSRDPGRGAARLPGFLLRLRGRKAGYPDPHHRSLSGRSPDRASGGLHLRAAAAHPRPAVLVNDAVTIPGISLPQVPVVKGDARCISIAAASILAKVSRDRYMLEMAKEYPQYAFEKHKGYPTKLHYERLRQYGPSPIHRPSFLRKMH